MTFLALDVQKNYMVLQRSTLEYQEMCATSNLDMVTSTLSQVISANSNNDNFDQETDPTCVRLQAMDQMYTNQQASIESQLKALNAQIESFEKAVDTNIKSECKLSISV